MTLDSDKRYFCRYIDETCLQEAQEEISKTTPFYDRDSETLWRKTIERMSDIDVEIAMQFNSNKCRLNPDFIRCARKRWNDILAEKAILGDE